MGVYLISDLHQWDTTATLYKAQIEIKERSSDTIINTKIHKPQNV
jgi:hypothetical protein